MMQTLRSADSSLLLDPSLLAPLHPEEHIEIVNGTVRVIDTKDETHLSEALKAMPKIIETMAASDVPSPLQRLNLLGRIQILNKQVSEFNDKIQSTGWITFLHVILCILTLGIFRLRSVLELEPIQGSLSDLFPQATNWNDIPAKLAQEELDAWVSSMVQHGHPEAEEQLQRFLQTNDKKKEEDTDTESSPSSSKTSTPASSRSPSPLPLPEVPFEERLAAVLALEPKEKEERIERIKTLVKLFTDSFITYPATQEENFRALGVDTRLLKKTEEKHPRETIRECFHKESIAEILEAFGLQNADWETGKNDENWQRTGNFPAGDAHSWWIYLLSESQFKELPMAVFLLLTPKLARAVNMGDEKWKERYLRCDPSLEKLQFFAKNGVFLPRVLFPIYPENQIAMSKKSVRGKPLEWILPFLLNTDSNEGKRTSGYIARLLSSEQIDELSPEQLKQAGLHLLRKELNHVTLEPQSPDPNLTKWISRLVKEDGAKELDAIVEGLISAEGIAFLQGCTAEFLWSFVSCLAKIKASNLSFLCSLISESKWREMLQNPNNDTLCLLFTSGVLEENQQALPKLLLQGDVTKLPDPLLRAATKTTCGKISDLDEKKDYPNLRAWISRLIEIDAKEPLLSHIAPQFANVYSRPPLLSRSEPQFLWNFLGYVANKASEDKTLLQRICQHLGDPTWEKLAKELDQTALPSLLQAGAGAEIGKFLSPGQIEALPAEIAKSLAPHACKGAAHFSNPNFPKLQAWIEKLIAIDAKAELGAVVQEVSQNRAFLSAVTPSFLWKFLPYVAANCPKTERHQTETPVQKICSRIENPSWKKMAGQLDEVALTSLLPAKVGGEIGQFLSPEQIQALSPENAKALAPHACKNAQHLGENDYLKLEAWITKLLDIKAEPELATITKEVRLNHRFLQAAPTPFLWKFLAYIPTIVPGTDHALQEVVPIVCQFIGEKRWAELLKEPNPLTLAALFNKEGFKQTYEIFIPVLDILKAQDFSDKALLTSLVTGCTKYTHSSGDRKKAVDTFKAQCEAKLKS